MARANRRVRSFCYVDDLVDGLVRLMGTGDDFTGPVNLGNPVEMTVIQLAEQVIRMTNSTSKIIYEKLPADDPVRRKPDIALANKALGWQPKVRLEDGLAKTIEYFRRLV